MANTRQSAKRNRQENRRQLRNKMATTKTKSALRNAVEAIQKKDSSARAAYLAAVSALSRAAGKGMIPARRAARKTSRLTALAKKVFPKALEAQAPTKNS